MAMSPRPPATVDAFIPDDPEAKHPGPELQTMLSNGEHPALIVTLKQPENLPPGLDRGRLINDVLETLSVDEFQVRRKHESLPGFSGVLLEESALDKLKADGRVVRIQLDQLNRPEAPN